MAQIFGFSHDLIGVHVAIAPEDDLWEIGICKPAKNTDPSSGATLHLSLGTDKFTLLSKAFSFVQDVCLPCIQELHYTYRDADVYSTSEHFPFILLASDSLRVLCFDFSMTDENCKAMDYVVLWTDAVRFQPTKLIILELQFIDLNSIHCDSLRHLINLEELTINDGSAPSASSKEVSVWPLFRHLTRSVSRICIFFIRIRTAIDCH